MAEPLNDGEWSRFWGLLGQGHRTHEEYADLKALHTQAQKYIDGWKPDPTLTNIHLTAAVTQMARMLRGLYDILPSAGGLRGHIEGIQSAVENLSTALNGPANIPPMPPAPDAIEQMHVPALEGTDPSRTDWPSPEQQAALEPVGPTDGDTDKKPKKK